MLLLALATLLSQPQRLDYDTYEVLIGGLGMAPSADIGDAHAVFQPCHGTAPDIAGKGIANPVATILSAAMMLHWLGSAPAKSASARIRGAVSRALEDPLIRTPDTGGKCSTEQITDHVIACI